jgi:hypothetical protein
VPNLPYRLPGLSIDTVDPQPTENRIAMSLLAPVSVTGFVQK